jgi:integrase/recombinase XerD
MKLSAALQGYFLEIQTSYAASTVRLYKLLMPKLVDYLGDPEVNEITLHDLQRFIQHLQTDYVPVRFGEDRSKLSPSAVDNYWKGTRSFFGWAEDALGIQRPDLKLSRPAYKLAEVTPFSESDVKRLLKACDYSDTVVSKNGKEYRMRRETVNRDKALILILLDTGLRVGELCRLKMQDVNLETGEILVAPFGSGQKTKPRMVYLGKAARRQLWLHVSKNRTNAKPKESLLDMSEKSVRGLLRRLGKKTGVDNVHPHRFRHTAAIMFLRNGGDIFSLQRLLGHSDLTMVRHYLMLADSDAEDAHRKASPADNWKL